MAPRALIRERGGGTTLPQVGGRNPDARETIWTFQTSPRGTILRVSTKQHHQKRNPSAFWEAFASPSFGSMGGKTACPVSAGPLHTLLGHPKKAKSKPRFLEIGNGEGDARSLRASRDVHKGINASKNEKGREKRVRTR